MRIAITSGYFNPMHTGHLEIFKWSKRLADKVFVIVNNDKQQMLKIGGVYQDEKTRFEIISALKDVDMVAISVDEDRTICRSLINAIAYLRNMYGAEVELIFTKGGDQFKENIPEREICDLHGVEIVDGLGEKIDNSSDYRNKSGKGKV